MIMNVKANNMYMDGPKMQQPFALLSTTVQHLGLIPRLSRPGKLEF